MFKNVKIHTDIPSYITTKTSKLEFFESGTAEVVNLKK
jgi:hypothetical protein